MSVENEQTVCLVNGRGACIEECPNYQTSRKIWLKLTGHESPARASQLALGLDAHNSDFRRNNHVRTNEGILPSHGELTHTVQASSNEYVHYLALITRNLAPMKISLNEVFTTCAIAKTFPDRS